MKLLLLDGNLVFRVSDDEFECYNEYVEKGLTTYRQKLVIHIKRYRKLILKIDNKQY